MLNALIGPLPEMSNHIYSAAMSDDATGRRFEGKAALVTGGGSGIGLGCAAGWRRRGPPSRSAGGTRIASRVGSRRSVAEPATWSPTSREEADLVAAVAAARESDRRPRRRRGQRRGHRGARTAPARRHRRVRARPPPQRDRDLPDDQGQRTGAVAGRGRVDRRRLVDRRCADPSHHGAVQRQQGRHGDAGQERRRRARGLRHPGQRRSTGPRAHRHLRTRSPRTS